MSGQADPKPPVVKRPRGGRTLRSQIYDPDANKRKLLEERECRIESCGRPAGGCHHLVPKGSPHFGDDVVENLIPLCGSGTTGHHWMIENHDYETRLALGAVLRPEEIAYTLRHLGPDAGRDYLLRRYCLMVPLNFVDPTTGEELRGDPDPEWTPGGAR